MPSKHERQLRRTAKLIAELQNRPYRARNYFALTDTSEVDSDDLRPSQRVSGLTWFMENRKELLFFYGDGVEEWLEARGERYYKPVNSDGAVWYQTYRPNGKARNQTGWSPWDGGMRMLAYSKDQYALIRWALWKFDEGWSLPDVHRVLVMFWPLHKGQSPLKILSIKRWLQHRTKMEMKGLQWP